MVDLNLKSSTPGTPPPPLVDCTQEMSICTAPRDIVNTLILVSYALEYNDDGDGAIPGPTVVHVYIHMYLTLLL